jgi:hypothetical protein
MLGVSGRGWRRLTGRGLTVFRAPEWAERRPTAALDEASEERWRLGIGLRAGEYQDRSDGRNGLCGREGRPSGSRWWPLAGQHGDRDHVANPAARAELGWPGEGGGRLEPGSRRPPAAEQVPAGCEDAAGGVELATAGGTEEAVAADLDEASRQHVLDEPCDELGGRERTAPGAGGGVVGPAEGDGVAVGALDRAVGECDPEQVAAEVGESVGAGADRFDMGDPGDVPDPSGSSSRWVA